MDFEINNEPIAKHPFDGEMGVFKKFRLEAKNIFFGILFLSLKGQETSIYTFVILTFIQLLQLLIFPFHPSVYHIWDTYKQSDSSERHPAEVVRALHSIFNYFNILSYMDETDWELYIIIFYMLLVFVGIFILTTAYIGFHVCKKRFSFAAWAITIFRHLSILFLTIFFIPFLYYFVSIPACLTDQRGLEVHSFYTEIRCWSGVHIIHAIFATFGSLFFVLITGILSLTFYEYKDSPNDSTSRVDSNANFLLLAYQTAMIVCLTFITGDQFQVLLITIMLIGSIILFFKFNFSTVYHNELISKLWSMVTAINLWTTSMLAFAKIMQNSTFKGSIATWIIGIPFIILIMLASKDHRLDLLLITGNKFQNGDQIRDQIRYILKLIDWQSSNRNANVLLDGYIEIHKQNCLKDNCPLKQKTLKNNRITKNLMRQNETINEKYAVLAQLLYKMYTDGVKKFPTNTSLRIAYAFFLIDRMQSKQQALQELLQAEQTEPNLEEQFIIFRYKRIVEDEIVESITEGKNNLDVVNETTFQTTLRQLQANIEKAALLHLEFWSQLAEDNPDLAKLNDIGSKINTSVHNVEETWNRIQKINENSQKALRLYGKFLLEVINDKEAGDQIIDKVRSLCNMRSNRKTIQMIGLVNSDQNADVTPTVWVSGEQDKFGVITGINLAAASLFGYSKTDLINRKMNVLMPEIYSKYHDSFFEHYINNGEANLVTRNRERLVLGKNKMNYIFPVHLSLRAIQSVIQGIQVIATFRVEKSFKSTAYVLTHPDGTIDSLSASAISLLKFDNKFTNIRKPNIQDFIPHIIRDRFYMFSAHNNTGRNLAQINYTYPLNSEYLFPNEDPNIQLNCQLTELIFSRMEESVGFQFKFERIQDKSNSSTHIERMAKISNFQFKFDRNAPLVMGEYFESSTITDTQLTPPEDDGIMIGQSISQHFSENNQAQQSSINTLNDPKDEALDKPKIDYAAGIKTLRLYGGRPIEIEDDRSEDNEESVESPHGKESSQQGGKNKHGQTPDQDQDQDSHEEGSYGDFNTTFKSRKALATMINDKTPPSSIINLRWTINILVLVLLVIAILDYVLAIGKFDDINKRVDLLQKSNERFAEMMTGLSKIRHLHLTSIGLTGDINNTNQTRSELLTALNSARVLKEQLEQETESLSSDHLNFLNKPTISLLAADNTTTNTGFKQATEEIFSRALNIYSMDISKITVDNADYFFITHNMLNNYSLALQRDAEYYSIELTKSVEGRDGIFLIFLVVSIAALGFTLLISFPILFQVNKNREEVLSLFLDIPEKTVKNLSNKCEIFISNLQVGDDDEIVSEIDEEDLAKHQNDKESQDLIPRRKKKKFKNSGRSQKTFYISFLAVALVVEAYFVFIFVYNAVLFNQVSTLIPEFNSTSSAERFYGFSNNVERQLFIDHDFPIIGLDAKAVATSGIRLMYDLNSQILEGHSININLHSSSYISLFNRTMNSNPCSRITATTTDYAACLSFADQIVSQGMTGALSRQFENLRTLLSCFIKIEANSSCSAEVVNKTSVVLDPIQNRVLNLMRTTQATEIQKMQNVYIKSTFRLLTSEFRQCLKDRLNNALTLELIILIVFVALLLTIYFVLWQTLAYKIALDVWRTKSMLNMIPLSVISKIKSIRLFLKRFWNERNLA